MYSLVVGDKIHKAKSVTHHSSHEIRYLTSYICVSINQAYQSLLLDLFLFVPVAVLEDVWWQEHPKSIEAVALSPTTAQS